MTRDDANPYRSPDPNFVGDALPPGSSPDDLRFHLSGAATAAEAAHALRLAYPRWWQGWVVIGVVGLLMFYLGLVQIAEAGSSVFLIAGIVTIGLTVNGAYRHVRQAKAWMRRGLGPCSPHELTVDHHHLTTKTVTSQSIETWAAYENFVNSKRVALLFYPGGSFRVVPRSFFPDEESWRRFLALLAEKLPRG